MRATAPTLVPVLRSGIQGRLLAVMFAKPDLFGGEHSITELARRAGTLVQTVIREIDRAEVAGLVSSRRVGNTRLVRADTGGRLHRPFGEIVLATYVLSAVLSAALSAVAGSSGPTSSVWTSSTTS